MSLRHRLVVLQRAGLCVHTLTAQSMDSIVRVTKRGGYDVVAGGGSAAANNYVGELCCWALRMTTSAVDGSNKTKRLETAVAKRERRN